MVLELHQQLKYEYTDFLNHRCAEDWNAVTEVGLENKRLDIVALRRITPELTGAVVFEVKAVRGDMLGYIRRQDWRLPQKHGAIAALLIPEGLEDIAGRVDPSVVVVIRRASGRWDSAGFWPKEKPSADLLLGIVRALRLTVMGRRDGVRCECLTMLRREAEPDTAQGDA